MKNTKLNKFWDILLSSYWFFPSLMALGGIALAFAMLALDRTDAIASQKLSWIYSGGPDGARELLSAVASSMMTVAVTAFSITIVALQLASSNFGPRLLRNFMQDRGNQIVLGTFIATFLYCLLVLRTIYGENYNLFVPQFSVTMSIILAILGTGVLIYFIHHASTIIQASYVIASVAEELDDGINRLFPEAIEQNNCAHTQQNPTIPDDFDAQARPINSHHTGYLQIIDNRRLLQLSCQHNLVFRLLLRPGEFIIKHQPLLLVYPGRQVNAKLIHQINQAFVLGRERTEHQDIEFPIDQLVEIALRALSPGINDPFTAIRCIDRLGAALTQLVQRPMPSAYAYDDRCDESTLQLRVIAEPISFETLVDLAFNQIRRYGTSDLVVTTRLLQAIQLIISHTDHFPYLVLLGNHAERIFQSSYDRLLDDCDRQRLTEHYQTVLTLLESRKARITPNS
ncbi:MAG: DUF2254 domain-containing protein [Snowella sp.]|nr:DUF2254 domain-containing protein [Snowella sp.]